MAGCCGREGVRVDGVVTECIAEGDMQRPEAGEKRWQLWGKRGSTAASAEGSAAI